MPTPLEILMDPIALVVMAMFGAVVAWEGIAPARPLPAVKSWRMRGLAAFLAYLMVSTYLPLLWSEQLARFQLLDLTALGTWGGAVVGPARLRGGCLLLASYDAWIGPALADLSPDAPRAERIDTFGAFWFAHST